MPLDRFVKPASALWRARAYLISGAVIWIASQTYTPPFSQIPADERNILETLLNKGLGSLDKAGIAIMLAGIAYAVLSDIWEVI